VPTVSGRRWIGPAGFVALALTGCGESRPTPQACLERAGYTVVAGSASRALHITAQLAVRRGRLRAGVFFFDSEAAAARDALALGQTLARTGGGMSVQRGTVVIGYARRPTPAERDRLERCLVP
jgi:hypothetical protein